MKKLSCWASRHVAASRVIIVASFILLSMLGFITGRLLLETGVSLSTIWLYVFLLLSVAGFAYYPSRSLKQRRNAVRMYVQQKSCDLLLTASTFLLILFYSNRPEQLFHHVHPAAANYGATTIPPKDSTVKQYKTIAAFSAAMKDETGKQLKWKAKKKLLREQIRAIKKSDMSNGGKVALIIVSVLVALGLLALVGALACNISCSGSEVGAIIVLLGGATLIIFLLVAVIRSINRKYRRQKENSPAPREG